MAMKKNISKAMAMAVTLTVLSGANLFGMNGVAEAAVPNIYGAGNGNMTPVLDSAQPSYNKLTILSINELLEQGSPYTNIYAGHAPSSGGDSLGNNVTIDKNVTVGLVYGGYAVSGSANSNKIYIKGTADADVNGGYVYYKTASSTTDSNYVEVSGTASDLVCGGGDATNASNNEVVITETGSAGDVMGAACSGEATGNKVTIAGTVSGSVCGGDGYTSATENTVIITGKTTSSKFIIGGYSGKGKATGNTVTISGTVHTIVYGGASKDIASGNTVTISGTAEKNVYGGWSDDKAEGNTVTISGTVKACVYGGYSEAGAVDNNTVTISGDAEIKENVYAGYTKTGDAGSDQGNKLIIKDGKVAWYAFAGYSEVGNVKNNIAVIEGGLAYTLCGGCSIGTATVGAEGAANQVFVEGGEVAYLAAGGYSNNIANYNEATISDGKVKVLVGGYSDNGAANNNEVTVYGGEVTEAVYGGYSSRGTADTNTINLGTKDGGVAKIGGNAVISYANGNYEPSQPGKDVLNVYGSGHTIGGNLHATKANLNFYIDAGDLHTGGKTMVDVTGTANITDSTINAGVMNVGQVDVGDKITLLSAGTLNADATLKTGKLSDGLIDVDLQIAKEGNSITATAGKAYVPEEPPKEDPLKENNANANPNAKSPVETMAAAISLLNAGSDMLATSSIASAEQAVRAEKDNRGMTVFTAVSGSNERINSGSHVDMKAWNANLGLAKEIANKNGKFLFAPVIEYGRGSYDSYLDNGVHGEGDSHFVGGGLLAKQTFNNDWYVDGSVRAGRMKADYKTSDIGTGISYDNSATYYAAHLGAGKVVKMTEKSSMDYYGKLFYSHQNSSTANLSSGHTYEFDAVDSFRTMLGLRYSQKAGKTASFYTGLAWQHEFDSECNSTVRSGAWSAEAPAPSVKGDTGILEVGYKFTPGNSGNFDVDFGAAGYVGKQRGGSLKLNMQWKF